MLRLLLLQDGGREGIWVGHGDILEADSALQHQVQEKEFGIDQLDVRQITMGGGEDSNPTDYTTSC